VQIVSGLAWAGFNLAAANFLFDAVSPPKRGRCVAYQSAINGVFVLAGSMTGGYLATHVGQPLHFWSWFNVPESPYLLLFLLSALSRGLVVAFFLRIFREVRPVEDPVKVI